MSALLILPDAHHRTGWMAAGGSRPTPPIEADPRRQRPEMTPRRAYTYTRVYVDARIHARYTSGEPMSTETRQNTVTDRPRRPRKAETRTWTWVNTLATAPTGEKALTDMMRWLWSALSNLDEQHPKAAEAARWEIARQLAPIIVRLTRARYELRAGITEDERQALLDPWGQRGGDVQ